MNKLSTRGFWTILGIMVAATFIIEVIIRAILGD